jgi:hypothetical protein
MGTSKSKLPRPVPERREILDLRTKDWGTDGPLLRFLMGEFKLTVETYATDVPQVRVRIQNGSQGGSAILDEKEVGRLVKGLLDALEASKAIAASPESQEAELS